jgi:hypothetical protein
MGKKSPAPPPAPDYAGAAQQQGIANLEAARLTARLSNPNVITPLGGQRVTYGRPQFNRAAYDAAMANYNARQAQKPSAPATGAPQGAPSTVGVGGGAAMPTTGGGGVQMGGGGMYGGGVDLGVTPEPTASKADGMPAARREALGMGDDRAYTQGGRADFTTLPTGAQVPTAMLIGGGRFDASGMGPGQTQRFNQGYGGGEYMGDVMPTREMFTEMVDLDTPTIEQYLTPEAQATLEAQQRVERALSGLGEQAIGRVQNVYGTDFTPQGLPAQQFQFGGYGNLPTLPELQGRARSDVSALPVNFGPTAGQYGMAAGGPQGLNLQGLDTSGISGVQTGAGQFGTAQGGPAAPTLQGQLDTSNLAAMPVGAGMTAQQAIMSRLDPQLQRQRAQLETQLANQGLVRGGEAFNAAIAEQQQQENDLRTQAALQGISLDMAARQQGLGEAQALGGFANQAALAGFGAGQQATGAQNAAIAQNAQLALQSGQFANQAQAQQFAQRLAAGEFGRDAQMASFQTGQAAQEAVNRAIAQNFQQGLGAAGAYNAAAGQQFGQEMDIAGLYNASLAQNQQAALQQAQAQAALQAQGFNQAQAAANFQNAQRQAALQEQLALRALPLNEVAAIMGGAQVQMPQFQAYQGAEVGAAPIFGATQAAGNFAQQNYANQTAAYNAKMGLYGNLAGAAGTAAGGGAFSDRRLKSNIVRVGTHPLNIGVYEYDIFDRRERGVMADEVEQVKPDAVTTHSSGYKMVNYGMLQ